MIARILAVVVALLGLPGPLGQQLDDEVSRLAIHRVIQNQLEAFRRDDGPAALDQTAPAVRQNFPSADEFLDTVRQAYPAVYRQRDARFGELKPTHIGLTQYVTLTKFDGEVWNALYVVAKQTDGNWKITGFYTFRLSETAI